MNPPSLPAMTSALLAPLACDLLVIGSGASGLAAAVTAAHHWLKVILVEKDAVFGGCHLLVGRLAVGARHPAPGALASMKTRSSRAPT